MTNLSNTSRKFLSVSLLCTLALLPMPRQAQAITYTRESLNYEIVYHWGVIWKHAASACLSIERRGTGYHAELAARTVSWADKIYPVRDTLRCNMLSNFTPTHYEKATHEDDYYARDVVNFSRMGSMTNGVGYRYRSDKPTARINLATHGQAYDMLSVFYMLRNLDFSNMASGKKYVSTVFSGKRKETVTIRYKGLQTVKMRNGRTRVGYHVSFTFTQKGGEKTSDDMDVWLSNDTSHVPLLLVGKLPLGEVKAYLV